MEVNILFMKTRMMFVFLSLTALSGCGVQNDIPASNAVTIQDMFGRNVTYDKTKIDRVVCIGAGALRYYSYVGDMSKIVAVEEIDGATPFGVGNALRPYYEANKSTFSALPNCGRGGPDAQTVTEQLATNILKNNPGIVISFLSSAEKNDDLFNRIQVPVVGLKQGPDAVFDQVTMNSLNLIARIFNKESRYNELKNYVDTCKADFENLTMTTEKYYAAYVGNWGTFDFYGSFYKFPVFKYAKVRNIVDEIYPEGTKPGQVTLDTEKQLALNPDYVFVDTVGYNHLRTNYNTDSSFKTNIDGMNAFQNGKTYKLLPYNAYFTNLEIQLMSTYYVASIAHPEAFATLDMDAKINEITTKFNGKALLDTMRAHASYNGGYDSFVIGE